MTEPAAPPARARRRRPRWALFAASATAVVVAVLVGFLAVSKKPGDSIDTKVVGEQAPALAGNLLQVDSGVVGPRPFDLRQLTPTAGKWVVVNFLASWCIPCQQEAPELKKWAEEHEAAGNAELVQVVFEKDPSQTAKLLRDNGGASWPVVAGDSNGIALDWGVAKVPETFLVAPNGVVVLKTIAPVTQQWLDQQLAQARAATGQ